MIKRQFILLFFVLFFPLATLFAQDIKSFSPDSIKFIDEMTAIFGKVNPANKSDAEKILQNFTALWKSDKIASPQRAKTYSTCNMMLQNRMKPYPQFASFLAVFIDFINSGQSSESFNAWNTGLNKIISGKNYNQFQNYLETSHNLLINHCLLQTRASSWKFRTTDFYFQCDSVPTVVFPSLDLICVANNDSSVVYHTKGIFTPLKNNWNGQGGTINWSRVGMEKVFATLDFYRISLNLNYFDADSVLFSNTAFFEKPILGKLEEKVMAGGNNKETATYPRFESYDHYLQIHNLVENIDYQGGFAMEGSKIIGSGKNNDVAKLIFIKDNAVAANILANRFLIREDKISSERASISIYFENDSIYHSGLTMRYLVPKKELLLTSNNVNSAITPFFDSYHKLDVYCEELNWKIGEQTIDFRMTQGINDTSRVAFESSNYYSAYRFDKLQGMDEINPLFVLANYSSKFGTSDFFGYELSDYMNLSIANVQSMLLNLANNGFIIYNFETDKVLIKPKLFDYLKARAGKMDYDVIKFNSSVYKQSNATLNLSNFDMTIRGVPLVALSDSQKVFIYPANQQIMMKKNRDFVFTGLVHAGFFDFYSHESSFEYDKFKLNLPTVDSLTFQVHSRERDRHGAFPLVKVKTAIADLSGELLIDSPDNKSSLKSFPRYPTFNSKIESFAFYDTPTIQNGAYKKEKFFYHVNPFTIDSLANFTTDALQFKGYLVSGGIFPNLDEPLKVQSDYSLGFVKKLPAKGEPVYDGKGTFFAEISLSNQGFIGSGTLNYLTSVSASDKFLFYPDSLNADLKKFEIKEQMAKVEFPMVYAEDATAHWTISDDLFAVRNKKDKSFSMYNGQTLLDGKLTLSGNGLTGEGFAKLKEADLKSDSFVFKYRTFDTDSVFFKLNTFDLKEMAMATHFSHGHIDFDQRKGEFRTKGNSTKVEFPANLYYCYMDQLDWFMEKEEIELINNISEKIPNIESMTPSQLIDLDLHGSEFVSTHPKQDSIKFYCLKARYNLKENVIYAEDVKLIKVADAAVFPTDGKVTILKNAQMKPLDDAIIIANTTNKAHNIYNAEVNIYTKHSYFAKGYYNYFDENGTMQPIYFENISVDPDINQTIASARISDSANFSLSPEFSFKGNIKMSTSKDFLNFDGYFMINHDCDNNKRSWVKFEAEVNPKNIQLPINAQIRGVDRQKLYASLMFSPADGVAYPAFCSLPRYYNDTSLLNATGVIDFNKATNAYRISTPARLNDPKIGDNYLCLNKEKCILTGEGTLNLGTDLEQLKLFSFGRFTHYIIPDSTTLETVLAMDFYFSDNALEKLQEDLKTANLKGVNLSGDLYSKALVNMVGVDEAFKLTNEMNLYGSYRKIPSGLNHTLVFTDIKFQWNARTKSYISYGPIGIGNIGKTPLNKYMNGYVELVKRRTGDIINIYLEISPKVWYYFNYSNSLLQAISSNNDFNNILIGTKEDKRTIKGKENEPSYQYIISTPEKRIQFMRKMQSVNEGN